MLGQEHEHVQLGTGTFIPFVSAEVQRPVGRVTLAVWGLAHLSLYDNDKGYRAGDRYSGGVTASFGVKSWTVSGAIEGHGETAETWQGTVYTDEGNAGRFDLMVGGGAAWSIRPRRSRCSPTCACRSRRHVAGTQLDYGPVLGIGIAGTFDVAPRASWRGLDHGVVASPGSAPDLVPVHGRVTVFDLWADWLPPSATSTAASSTSRAHTRASRAQARRRRRGQRRVAALPRARQVRAAAREGLRPRRHAAVREVGLARGARARCRAGPALDSRDGRSGRGVSRRRDDCGDARRRARRRRRAPRARPHHDVRRVPQHAGGGDRCRDAGVGERVAHRVGGAIAPGTLVAGRYHIEQVLGEGGMGRVFVAQQLGSSAASP